MCTGISWHQFISALLFLLMAYYLAIVFFKYRSDIMAWATLKINPARSPEYKPVLTDRQDPGSDSRSDAKGLYAFSTSASSKGKSNEQSRDDNSKPVSHHAVHELTHDLQIIFDASSAKKTRKQDILKQIGKVLQDHKQLKGTNLEGEILQHIVAQAKESCSVHLNPDELNNLWNS